MNVVKVVMVKMVKIDFGNTILLNGLFQTEDQEGRGGVKCNAS